MLAFLSLKKFYFESETSAFGQIHGNANKFALLNNYFVTVNFKEDTNVMDLIFIIESRIRRRDKE